MRFLHRFTRDDVSAWVWWPLAIGLVGLCLLTIPGGNRAVNRARFAVADPAVEVTKNVLAPLMSFAAPVSVPLDDQTAHAFKDAVEDQILGNPRVKSVRLWTPDGRMLWSSVPGAELGSAHAANDDEIGEAVDSPGSPVQFVTEETLTGEQGPATLQTYVGLGGEGQVVAVAQIELSPDESLVGPTADLWGQYRIVLGVAAAFVLLLALLSLRSPVAPIGAGVPFFPESIPRDKAVVDARRLRDLEEAGAMANARLAAIGSKLREGERAREVLEAELHEMLAAHVARSAAPGPEAGDTQGRPPSSSPSSTSRAASFVVLPDAERAADPASTRSDAAGDGSSAEDGPDVFGSGSERPRAIKRAGASDARRRHSDEPDTSYWR